MEVLEEQLGTIIGKDDDKFAVLIDGHPHLRTEDQTEAWRVFQVLTPRKVKCDECGEIDVVRFRGELGVGRNQVPGDGGWRMERIFGGLVEFRDVATCRECTIKINERVEESRREWQKRKSRKARR